MASCCAVKEAPSRAIRGKVVIVGNPNVGKSVLFNRLTGLYTTVSNYPGTTVEVARGAITAGGKNVEVIDTPGLYSFLPVSEEERVALNILLDERPDLIVHVIDAKNLERMLPLTIELMETGSRLILVLNMMDEARRQGVRIDRDRLAEVLGIPVVETVSTSGEGLAEVRRLLAAGIEGRGISRPRQGAGIRHVEQELQAALQKTAGAIGDGYGFAPSAMAGLLLRNDSGAWELLERRQPGIAAALKQQLLPAAAGAALDLALALKKEAAHIAALVFTGAERSAGAKLRPNGWGETLSRLSMNPWTGFPLLAFILYWGLYQFVGVFGAGTAVGFLEETIFEERINPLIVQLANSYLPFETLRDLLAGEYGILTLGLRYAMAIILPVVGFFFLAFSVLEDSGYLPRLAMLMDRTFKKIGLSGRAVIPMVLGLGCDTMATMVTRTLPTRRERLISSLLLSLAIPCSAQLGVIFAVLSGHGTAVLLWAAVVISVFLTVGSLSARLLPGERASFYMELPPLRLPKLGNVLTKTYVRVKWYFMEIFPLFLLASFLIWLGRLTGLFEALIGLLQGPVALIGLPDEAAAMFLMGFFRRDYGAAGLYDLQQAGLLAPAQLLVACVALTLFLPCVAQFLINVKERGWKSGVLISLFTLFVAFGVAFCLNSLLKVTGVFA